MPTTEQITSFITDYANEKERRYAVAVVGEWGSGKTRYVETRLRGVLEAQGLSLVRVSMFGLSSVEELFERILAAVARFPGNKGNSKTMRGEAVFDGLKGFLSHLLKRTGVSYQASAKFAASFMCGDGTVLVLDDVERRNQELDQAELFGAINNLVENQGCKVVFIANSAEAIDAEIREKLVWRIVSFEPDMRDVVRSVFGDMAESCPFNGALELLDMAAYDSGCVNVRAMIKSEPLVRMAFASSVVNEGPYASENVRHALRELLAFAFETAMGKAPEDPSRVHNAGDVSDDERMQWVLDKMRYERYRDARVIGDFFDPSRIIKQDDVDASIDEYMRRRYPESEDVLEMKTALERLKGCTTEDDETVVPKIERLSCSIRKCSFDPYDLVSALEVNDYLFKLGFEEAVPPDESLSCAKKVIDLDVDCAFVRFHGRYKEWNGQLWHDCEALRQADAYCVNQHEKAVRSNRANQLDLEDSRCGVVMAQQLREAQNENPSSFLDAFPGDIAKCFERGNAESQMSIFEFIKSLDLFRWSDSEKKEEVVSWLEELSRNISAIELNSKLGPVRKRWTLDAIESVKKANQ